MAIKLATFKWFTDTYTRGTWEAGVSSTIFNTSRTNVSATSNKLINYNDLYTPSVYYYDYDGEIGTITAVANQCVTQGQIDSLMRKNNYTLAFQKGTSGNVLYIKMTDLDTSAGIPPNNTIKIRIKINNTSVYDVDVSVMSGDVYTLNYSTTINYVSIIGVSVFRPSTSTSYIVKPRIHVNFTSNLNGAMYIEDQATLFSYINIAIPNFVTGDSPGTGGGGTTGRVLNINSSWKSTDEAEDSGLNFELCWGYVDSKVDTNIYLITNPLTGTAIYVEDDNKVIGEYIGKYIVFKGETIDISVPLFTVHELRDWGDTYSL
jgi:hypothetical protein